MTWKVEIEARLAVWLVVAAAAGPIMATPGNHETKPQIAGIYRTASESEWDLQVELREDGSLWVELASWPAEDPTRVFTEIHEGRWRSPAEQRSRSSTTGVANDSNTSLP